MTRWVTCAALSVGLSACERGAAVPDAGAPRVGVAKDVVATVNGVPVTRFEVLLRTRTMNPSGGGGADASQQALDAIVTEELFAQRAKALGLEQDLAFLEEMSRVEAQVAEVRRRELTKVLVHKDIIAKADVTLAEARAHYDTYPRRFGHQVRVAQLTLKGRGLIDAAYAELQAGKSFDEVAAARLPLVPKGEKPWELPAMRWQDVPVAWWPALDALEPGQVSPPFLTVNERWVVLKLLERSPLPDAQFDAVRPLIQAQLKAERIDARRKSLEAELRSQARIELVVGPLSADAGP